MGRSGFSVMDRDPPALNKPRIDKNPLKKAHGGGLGIKTTGAVALGSPPDFSRPGFLVNRRLNWCARWYSAGRATSARAGLSGSSWRRGLRKPQRGLVDREASPCAVASAMGYRGTALDSSPQGLKEGRKHPGTRSQLDVSYTSHISGKKKTVGSAAVDACRSRH